MKRAITGSLLILFIAAAAAAQRQRSVSPPVQAASDWKIDITTTGGFTGRGSGGITVASDGMLVITLTNPQPQGKACTFRLTADEVRMIDAAVRAAAPANWLECYTPADRGKLCCDLIKTELTLTMNGGRSVFVTSWLSGDALPADLRGIVDVLRGAAGIDSRYRPLCTP